MPRQIDALQVNFTGDASSVKRAAQETETALSGSSSLAGRAKQAFSNLGGAVKDTARETVDSAKGFANLVSDFGNGEKAAQSFATKAGAIGSALSGIGGVVKDIDPLFGALFGTVGNLANALATGGPLALGITAFTVALGLAAQVVKQLREEIKVFDATLKSVVAGGVKLITDRTNQLKDIIKDTAQDIRDFGKTATQAARDQLREELNLELIRERRATVALRRQQERLEVQRRALLELRRLQQESATGQLAAFADDVLGVNLFTNDALQQAEEAFKIQSAITDRLIEGQKARKEEIPLIREAIRQLEAKNRLEVASTKEAKDFGEEFKGIVNVLDLFNRRLAEALATTRDLTAEFRALGDVAPSADDPVFFQSQAGRATADLQAQRQLSAVRQLRLDVETLLPEGFNEEQERVLSQFAANLELTGGSILSLGRAAGTVRGLFADLGGAVDVGQALGFLSAALDFAIENIRAGAQAIGQLIQQSAQSISSITGGGTATGGAFERAFATLATSASASITAILAGLVAAFGPGGLLLTVFGLLFGAIAGFLGPFAVLIAETERFGAAQEAFQNALAGSVAILDPFNDDLVALVDPVAAVGQSFATLLAITAEATGLFPFLFESFRLLGLAALRTATFFDFIAGGENQDSLLSAIDDLSALTFEGARGLTTEQEVVELTNGIDNLNSAVTENTTAARDLASSITNLPDLFNLQAARLGAGGGVTNVIAAGTNTNEILRNVDQKRFTQAGATTVGDASSIFGTDGDTF